MRACSEDKAFGDERQVVGEFIYIKNVHHRLENSTIRQSQKTNFTHGRVLLIHFFPATMFMRKLLLYKAASLFALVVVNVSPGHSIGKEEKNVVSPLYTCFEGYSLTDSGHCVQHINEPQVPVCPPVKGAGDGTLEEAGCRVQIPVLKGCSEGHTLTAKGDCSYVTYSSVKYFCPAGYTDDGTSCVQRVPGDILTFCSEGTKVGDQCVRTETVPAEAVVSCPDQSILEDGRCWHIAETYDCTGEFKCQDDMRGNRNSARNWSAYRHLVGKTATTVSVQQEDDVSVRSVAKLEEQTKRDTPTEELVPVTAPQPFKVHVISQTCQKLLEVPTVTVQTCPAGYSARDTALSKTSFLSSSQPQTAEQASTECFKEDYFPLKAECVETKGPPESCPPKIMYTPKQPLCSDGAPGKKGQCEESVVVPGTEYCPANFQRDGAFCVGYIEPPLECPPGLKTTPEGRCVGIREHTPVLVTPSVASETSVVESALAPNSASTSAVSSLVTPAAVATGLRNGPKTGIAALHKVKTFKTLKAIAG